MQAKYPEAAHKLQKHTYVDDIGESKETKGKVKRITEYIDNILKIGKFEVKAWHSNEKSVDQTHEISSNFLGYQWIKTRDTFTFKKQEIAFCQKSFTKRKCFSSLAQFWDPIVLVLPITIKLRINLQEMWNLRYEWDDILSEQIQDSEFILRWS